jgi:hypothetical protein
MRKISKSKKHVPGFTISFFGCGVRLPCQTRHLTGTTGSRAASVSDLLAGSVSAAKNFWALRRPNSATVDRSEDSVDRGRDQPDRGGWFFEKFLSPKSTCQDSQFPFLGSEYGYLVKLDI